MKIDAPKLGRWGENISCAFLKLKGMRILARNYRVGRFELDIVAADGKETVFVEVKVRSGSGRGGPLGAVGFKKQRGLTLAAAGYLADTGAEATSCRFDVIAIIVDERGRSMALRHIERAFESNSAWGLFA